MFGRLQFKIQFKSVFLINKTKIVKPVWKYLSSIKSTGEIKVTRVSKKNIRIQEQS